MLFKIQLERKLIQGHTSTRSNLTILKSAGILYLIYMSEGNEVITLGVVSP